MNTQLKFLPVNISSKALEEIKHILKEKNIPSDYALRILVKLGGCSGVSHSLGFDFKKNGDDEFTYDGIKIYIAKKDLMFLMGMEIDFVDDAEGRGFVFNQK